MFSRVWKAIRYSSIGSFFAGIVFVIQGCSIEREGVLGVILLLLLQFCSVPVDTGNGAGDSGTDQQYLAVGAGGTILHTTDGGATWSPGVRPVSPPIRAATARASLSLSSWSS